MKKHPKWMPKCKEGRFPKLPMLLVCYINNLCLTMNKHFQWNNILNYSSRIRISLEFLDDYYEEDLRARERTFSEGSALKGQQPPKDAYNIRRRNISPNSHSYDGFDDVNLDDNEGLGRHNTMPRGKRKSKSQSKTPPKLKTKPEKLPSYRHIVGQKMFLT